MRDFEALPRSPELNYLHKRALLQGPRAAPASQQTSMFQKLAIFSANDWVGWVFDYLRYRIGPKRAFATYPSPATDDGIYPLGDGAVRVAVAGDWGTGTDEAHTVAERIKKRDPHFTLHLGDIYFVGDPAEVRENFLGLASPSSGYTPCRWPHGRDGAFALNGNHEMYARGIGYFDLALPTLGMTAEGKGKPQKASFFCLQNEHWRVIALDTGYNSVGLPLLEQLIAPDCALPDPLLAWLRDGLKQKDDKRGIVLLSHHQYYSRFEDCYVKPAEQLAEFIARPVLWLWGHEHRLAIYDKRRLGVGIEAYGRCVGHGGMPVALPPDRPAHPEIPVEFVDSRPYANHEGLKIGVNGFAALTFEGDTLEMEYEDVAGIVIYSETWTTDREEVLTRVKAGAPAPAETAAAT